MRHAAFVALALACAAFPGAAQAAVWIVDPVRSSVSFHYTEDGITKQGAFAEFSAKVLFDPARVEDSRASFVVQTASIDLDDALREGVLATTPWFDSERYPEHGSAYRGCVRTPVRRDDTRPTAC